MKAKLQAVHLWDSIEPEWFKLGIYLKLQQPGNTWWEGMSPCVQWKISQKCYIWKLPKRSNMTSHAVPEMPVCELEFSICLCCSSYSLSRALWVLFLIIDLLTPHCVKTFLFRVVFAESTACFYILYMFQVFIFRDLYIKTRFVQSHVCDLIILTAIVCNTPTYLGVKWERCLS